MIYVVLLSLVRLVVILKLSKAFEQNNFSQIILVYRKLKKLTCFQIFNMTVFIITCATDIKIGEYWSSMLFNVQEVLITVACTAFNVYTLYIFYSYTKHLGLGNLAIINGTYAAAVNTTSNYGEILVAPGTVRSNLSVLNIGNPLTNTGVANINDANACQTGSSYPSFEDKIVLSLPGDIAFCQTAQNAIINGIILPSGLKVPAGKDGKNWRVIGSEIILI
jgi:hypothetical protein